MLWVTPDPFEGGRGVFTSQVEYPDGHPLSPADLTHLQQLRAVVQKALEDSQLSKAELDSIEAM